MRSTSPDGQRQLRATSSKPWSRYHAAASSSPRRPRSRCGEDMRRSPRSSWERERPRRSIWRGALELALLADLGRLAGAATEVVQLRPADVAPLDDLDLGDRGRVQRERALDADAIAQ